MNYILDKDNNVIRCSDEAYSEWWRDEQNFKVRKVVGRTAIGNRTVSTVFLPRWAFSEIGSAYPFETMVFEDAECGCPIYEDVYLTWDEAATGHERAVRWVNMRCKYDSK